MMAEGSGNSDQLDSGDVEVTADVGYGRKVGSRTATFGISGFGGSISLTKSGQEKANNIFKNEIGKQLKYREKGAKKGDILNYEVSMLDRFKDSGLDPEARVSQNDAEAQIDLVIEKVKGLKELYQAMGSPKVTFKGRSSEGNRGFTYPDSTVDIYNNAFSNYFWLASTLFHEFVHVYQNKGLKFRLYDQQKQAYGVEWKLADDYLRRKYKAQYKSIWKNISNEPYPYK